MKSQKQLKDGQTNVHINMTHKGILRCCSIFIMNVIQNFLIFRMSQHWWHGLASALFSKEPQELSISIGLCWTWLHHTPVPLEPGGTDLKYFYARGTLDGNAVGQNLYKMLDDGNSTQAMIEVFGAKDSQSLQQQSHQQQGSLSTCLLNLMVSVKGKRLVIPK